MNLGRMLPLVALLVLPGCDESTTLTGPAAVAAAERFQAASERGTLNFHATLSDPDRREPLIFVDGRRYPERPDSLLRSIQPEDIERIEVVKGCRARGFWGDDARGGVIHIYTKQFDGETRDYPEFSEDRAEACRIELERRRTIRR